MTLLMKQQSQLTAQLTNAISRVSAGNPLWGGLLFGTLRGLVGDSTAQRLESKGSSSTDIFKQDWSRTGMYVAWSCCVALLYETLVYRLLFPRIFPTSIGGVFNRSNVIKATFVDNLLIVPAMYFPAFYAFKDVVIPTISNNTTDEVSPNMQQRTITDAMEHYKQDFVVQNGASLLFWCPTGYAMFKYAPPAHRVAFSAMVSCGYILMLSSATQFLEKRRQNQSATKVARFVRRATHIAKFE